MTEPQLSERFKGLSQTARADILRSIFQTPEEQQNLALRRLGAIPELSDLVGQVDTSIPSGEEKKPKSILEKALNAANAPSRWFGAAVTDPFTPAVEGTGGLPWWQRQQAEYSQWREPVLGTTPWGYKIQPTKGLVESAPWLLVPGAGGVAGKLGTVAAKGGLLGTAAKAAALGLKPAIVMDDASLAVTNKLANAIRSTSSTAAQKAKNLRKLRASQFSAAERVREETFARTGNAQEALLAAQKAMGGKTAQAVELPAKFQEARAQITPEDVQQLSKMIFDSKLKIVDQTKAATALTSLLDEGEIPVRSTMVLFERVFGRDVAKALLDMRSRGEKLTDFAWELTNAPRALLSSFDLSGTLRQGGLLAVANPKQGLMTVRPMVQSLINPKNEKLIDEILRSKKYFNLSQQHGLFHADTTDFLTGTIAGREEAFMSNFFKFIPDSMNPIKASNRAYLTGLNHLRQNIWEKTIDSWKRAGANVTDVDLDDLAKFINYATGRGDRLFVDLEKHGSLLSTMLFSPRLIASRFQVLGSMGSPVPFVTKTPVQAWASKSLTQKEAIKTLVADLGAGSALLTAFTMAKGGSINLDPRSSDFAKLKIGSSRYDIWTGYSQYARFLAQLATAQKKTESGRISQLSRKEITERFLQSKSAPFVSLLVDLARGETFTGEDIPFKSSVGLAEQIKERFAPLVIQDTIDAIEQDGLIIGTSAGLSAAVGIGITTYSDDVKKVQDKIARDEYGMKFDEVGQNLGKLEQLKISQQPEVIKAEKENELRYGVDTKSTMGQYQALGTSIEEHYKKLVNNAVNEFRNSQNGVAFREAIKKAKDFRRESYAARTDRPEFQSIVKYYKDPMTPGVEAKMSPSDVARKRFYELLYADDMYDAFGNYKFDEAEKRERLFVREYGQEALDYVEAYQSEQWADRPVELRVLEQAQKILEPLFEVEDSIWSQYPPELRAESDRIRDMERNDPIQAKMEMRKNPQILRVREQIALQKRILKQRNPAIRDVYNVFYGR